MQRLVYNLFFYGRIVLSPYTWIIHIRMKQYFFFTSSSCQKSRYHARVDQLQWNRICPSAIYFQTPHSRSYFALWVHTTCKWIGIVLLAIHIGMAGIVLDATYLCAFCFGLQDTIMVTVDRNVVVASLRGDIGDV